MKNLLILFLVVTPFLLRAQKKSEILVQSTCECLQQGDVDKSSYDALVSSLGMCMAPDAIKYYDDLCKEFRLNKNDDLTTNMEKIGEQVGVMLMSECPEFRKLAVELMQYEEFQEEFLGDAASDDVLPPAKAPDQLFEGKVEKIESGELTTITVAGKEETFRFYWLDRYPSSTDFEANPNQLIGKKATISYTTRFFYDASSGLYSAKKVITGITLK